MNTNLMICIICIKESIDINNCDAKLNSIIKIKSKTRVILSLLLFT